MNGMSTPRRRVHGLGAARSGSTPFWIQRVTAVANIPLTVCLVALFVALAGSGYETARTWISNPLIAIILILAVTSGVIHMRLGMQVIIEDYVHAPGLKIACLAGNILFSAAIAVTCIYAVLRISLGS